MEEGDSELQGSVEPEESSSWLALPTSPQEGLHLGVGFVLGGQ